MVIIYSTILTKVQIEFIILPIVDKNKKQVWILTIWNWMYSE